MQTFTSHEEHARRSGERKRFLRKLFDDVMLQVDVTRRMQECVVREDTMLRLGPDRLDLREFSRVQLLAIGKAAVPMAEHVLQQLSPIAEVAGVVSGVGSWSPPSAIRFFPGGHPVPDEHSFAAGRALLELVQSADDQTLVLFLISGGASSMAEAPLSSALAQADVAAFYRCLLHSGLAIQNTNALRKHVSAIKGGRLAVASGPATRATVLLSDVPPGMLDVVGSGPSLPDTSTVEDCRKLLFETDAFVNLSPAMKAFLAHMPETPKRLPEGRFPSTSFSALSSDSLVEAAKALATSAGYRPVVDNTCDDWEYSAAAQYLVQRARQESTSSGPVCLISAGEVTVKIAGAAGVGGRNQQWALETARLIQHAPELVALSAGSDGVDGNSPAAGAVVGADTWSRAEQLQLDPAGALARFAAYPVFEQLGDALLLGPAGNNLRDLRLLLVE